MLPHLKSILTDHLYITTVNERDVIKHAPDVRLRREKEVLRLFEGDAYIRQLIDHGKDSPFLVLEQLDSDALRLSRKAWPSKQDIQTRRSQHPVCAGVFACRRDRSYR